MLPLCVTWPLPQLHRPLPLFKPIPLLSMSSLSLSPSPLLTTTATGGSPTPSASPLVRRHLLLDSLPSTISRSTSAHSHPPSPSLVTYHLTSISLIDVIFFSHDLPPAAIHTHIYPYPYRCYRLTASQIPSQPHPRLPSTPQTPSSFSTSITASPFPFSPLFTATDPDLRRPSPKTSLPLSTAHPPPSSHHQHCDPYMQPPIDPRPITVLVRSHTNTQTTTATTQQALTAVTHHRLVPS